MNGSVKHLKNLMLLACAGVALTFAGPAAAGENMVCEAELFDKKARLWFEDGAPVKYKWYNRSALKAQLRGDTIRIQSNPVATISNVVVKKAANGQKTVTGDFKFKSNRKDGLVFTCKPD